MIQLKDAKNKERIVFISISVMPSSNSCLEIYIITHNPNLHGPVIFGDSLELVPGPGSLFQYHVGRRDSIQCTHMFSLRKNGFFFRDYHGKYKTVHVLLTEKNILLIK